MQSIASTHLILSAIKQIFLSNFCRKGIFSFCKKIFFYLSGVKNHWRIWFTWVILVSFAGCKGDVASILSPKRVAPPAEEYRPILENRQNKGRSSWQKPEYVISLLGDIKGKKIADIGAGTGYFVYRLAYREAEVIAIDIDPVMLEFIDDFKHNLPEKIQKLIHTRLAKPNDPKLKNKEVDKAIIINTISYIKNIPQYLKTLFPYIKKGGEILILDYKNKLIDIPAPPIEDRIPIGLIQVALKDAGFVDITVDDTSLEYQYIIKAKIPTK